ncbi:MAG: CBS domain-containing protein [Thermoproteota archaeon]|jgi:CBS domain-containing protein|nr:CBS domain-containing protein [Thermoproteota archaeon]
MSAVPISSMLKINDDNTSNNIIILDKNKTAADAVSLMKEKSVRCVLVSNKEDNQIIGLVSKTDILYRVVSLHKNPARTLLKDIMSAPIISIPLEMSISDTLSVMEKHDIRQVVISSGSTNVYGIVDREEIITKMEKAVVQMEIASKENSSTPLCIMNPLASLHIQEKSSSLICPHCKTEYTKKELLSRHVRETHPASETSV